MAGPLAWPGNRDRATVGVVIDGVDELASAVTTPLGPGGPLAALTGTLTDALDGVWAEFFGAATMPGGTNWNAYSHQQLYDMLWHDADVGDVGAVAAEWGRHGTALTGFADALRAQGAALRSNWQGRAAELAADRLAELSDRIWNVGARAGAVGKAVGGAGDALALARHTMPPPPPDPLTLLTSAIGAGPLPPLQAIAVGAARLFTGDATAGAAKAEAVRVMQRYEASLANTGRQVGPAHGETGIPATYRVDGRAGTTNPAATSGAPGITTSLASFAGGGPAVGPGGGGGVPWDQLVGGGSAGSAASLGGAGDSGAGPVQSVLAAEDAVRAEVAAGRAGGADGMWSPLMGGRTANRDQDRPHRNRMPTVNNRLFAPDQRATVPVIGEDTERGPDDGR